MTGRLARLLEAPLRAPARPIVRADAAVVLGAPVGPGPGLSAPLEERVRWGAELWRRGLAPLVCVSGTPHEADAMQRRIVELGVPAEALRIDRAARNTAENAANSAAILLREGAATAWIVSQPFHLRRACFLFRRHGINAWPWPGEGERAVTLRWVMREYVSWARLAVARSLARWGPRGAS